MRRLPVRGAGALLAGTLLPLALVSPARAAPDRSGVVGLEGQFTWRSAAATGLNLDYDPETGEPCGKERDTYCDVTLLQADVAPSFWETHTGYLLVHITLYTPNPVSDFDLYLYESDAAGTRGRLLGSSRQPPALAELVSVPDPTGYYLVQVVYSAVRESRFSGRAWIRSRSLGAEQPSRFPPDVDQPPGVQEVLASDPGRGFRSHSEPHVAQSPLDPDVLVAGSKMYNADPDSLAEYEFKVGTYVSFDRGQHWVDLGQLAVCPAEQAPPESWPANRCYPEEDPARDGTGGEDGSRGGGGDWAEEYITSDVWVQFDDEGNAYAMVLDAPPFPGGAGWGMTLHRWESVSPEDLVTGRTWSERIPINAYDPARRLLNLDDKNTFAVNNAGPDGDGRTGVMVACWGQVVGRVDQQVVCEPSFDGGRSWPLEPIPIPGATPRAIGVYVVADPVRELTFYATWYDPLRGTIEFARTDTAGLSWVPSPSPVASVNGLPAHFPGQAFRNVTLPAMATGPNGEIYVAYADYRRAPEPETDADGGQADIIVVRSDDGGLNWDVSANVTGAAAPGENVNADQFQPVIAVTPSGQVNVAYFDRRLDPANLFADVWLARSNDGGRTFTTVRLSHDMADPELNAPVSPWGLFFGDYQGLVADDCGAVAFFNHSHLAFPADRDPDFDAGLPRSLFQEVFAWVVPNVSSLGGDGVGCPTGSPGLGGTGAAGATSGGVP